MKKLLGVLFILTVLILASGCAVFESLTVKDRLIYADEGPLGSQRFHTLTNQQVHIPKSRWDEIRVGMLCLDVSDFGDIKANEEKACSMLPGGCNYEQQQKVQTFFSQMNKAKQAAVSAKQNSTKGTK